jgi:hypothetical protein
MASMALKLSAKLEREFQASEWNRATLLAAVGRASVGTLGRDLT